MALLFLVSEIFVLLFLHVFCAPFFFFRKCVCVCVGVIIKINIHDQYVQLAPRLNSRLSQCICGLCHSIHKDYGITYQEKAPMSNPLNLNRFNTGPICHIEACNKFLNKYPTQVLHFHIHPICMYRSSSEASIALHYYIVSQKRRKTIEEKH